MREKTLDLESKKKLFNNLSTFFQTNFKYQSILFFTFLIAIYTASLVVVSYPPQKIIPKFKCITDIKNSSISVDPIFNKIITDEKCIRKYCNEKSKKLIKNSENFEAILVDYNSLTNFITIFDAFCDYDEFFFNLNFLINFGRIIGGPFLSYIADISGRRIILFTHIYIMIISYLLIFLINIRIFFYIFFFITSMNRHLYSFLQVYSNETMSQKTFSLYAAFSACIYTSSGIICMLIMYYVKNVYFIYLIQLISVLLYFSLSLRYVKETFPYSIKWNLFEKCFIDMKNINSSLNLGIEKNPKYSSDFKKVEKLVNFKNDKKNNHKNSDKEKVNLPIKIYNTDEIVYSKYLNNNVIDNTKFDDTDFSNKNHLLNKKRTDNENTIENKKNPFKIIFTERKNLILFFKFLILFFTIFMIYYGCIFNIEILFSDINSSTIILFVGEFIGEFSCGYILRNYERIKSIKISFIISGVIFFIITLIENEAIKIILFFIAIIFFSYNYIAIHVLSAETFDVEIKNTMINILSNSSCVFLIFFPSLIKYLPDVFLLFAISCLLSAFVLGGIKETFKR